MTPDSRLLTDRLINWQTDDHPLPPYHRKSTGCILSPEYAEEGVIIRPQRIKKKSTRWCCIYSGYRPPRATGRNYCLVQNRTACRIGSWCDCERNGCGKFWRIWDKEGMKYWDITSQLIALNVITLPVLTSRLLTEECRMPTVDCRLSTVGCWLSTPD